jgi:hypothetical protein
MGSAQKEATSAMDSDLPLSESTAVREVPQFAPDSGQHDRFKTQCHRHIWGTSDSGNARALRAATLACRDRASILLIGKVTDS